MSRERKTVERSLVRGVALAFAIGTLLALTAAASPALAQKWQQLGPKQRYNALQNYYRHEQLPQERRRDIEKHYERWQGMSADERNRIRQNYERFRQLPPKERERMQRKYEKWRREGGPSP
jgi:hypothetical protein